MKNKLQRFISIFLSLVLVLQLVPVQALGIEPIDLTAEEIVDTETPGMISQSTAAVNDAQIVGEIMEGRSEFQKEFQLDNGMQMIAVYPKPVHYEEDGEWKEIDNTLQLTMGKISLDGSTNGSFYRNTAGIWDVSLPATLNSNAPVTVSRDGYSLSFRLTGEIHNDHVIMGVEDETEQVSAVAGDVQVEAEEPATENLLADSGELSGGLDAMTTESTDPSASFEEIPVILDIEDESVTEGSTAESEAPVDGSVVAEEGTSADGEDTPAGETEATVEGDVVIEEDVSTSEVETPDNASPNNETSANDIGLSGPVSGNVESVETMALVQSSSAKLGVIETPTDNSGKIKEQTILTKLNTALEYENVYSNTDLRYDLVSHTLKESIIIKSADQTLAGYSYTLSTTGLVLELQDDNSILAYASDAEADDAPIFTMPAPYLVDAEHAYSGDVSVSLTGSNGNYTLTYRLPRQWMMDNERVYPVTLDPIVDADSSTLTIEDQTVTERQQPGRTWEYLEAGYTSTRGRERIFIRFNTLPEMGAADVIVSAKLCLLKATNTNEDTMEAHEVFEDSWSSSTITWDTMPAYNEAVEDFQRVSAAGPYSWDITNIAQKWYNNDSNTGVMLQMSPSVENGGVSDYHQFFSSDAYQAYIPQLIITHVNNTGLEDYWDYTSQSAGRAGTGYINNFSGNLSWVHEGLSFSGNRMPVSINLVYNANDEGLNSWGLGYGWRTNYNQRVRPWTKDSSYFVWQDQDGSRRFFSQDKTDPNKYVNELDGDLILTVDTSKSWPYTITDKDGNTSRFDSEGRLRRINNNQQQKSYISIEYVSGTIHIDNITDGAGRLYKFEYTTQTDGTKEVHIKYYGTRTETAEEGPFSTLTYKCDDEGNLSEIVYPDSEAIRFDYIDAHLLTSATDIDGYTVTYTYNTPASTMPNRITAVAESDGNVTGGNLSINYAHNQTTFKDHNQHTEIHQFNNFGSTVSIQDDQGRAQFAEYAGTGELDNENFRSASQMTLSSNLQNTVVDLIRDGSFELENGSWASANGTASSSWGIDTSDPYLEQKSLWINSGTVAPAAAYLATAQPGKNYTLSAYVKAPENTAASISLGVSTDSDLRETTTATPNNGWQRIEVTYTHPETADPAPLIPYLTAVTGTVRFDCVQLEEAAAASRYNIIEDGDFRFCDTSAGSHYAWNPGTNCGSTEKFIAEEIPTGKTHLAAPQLDNNVFKVTGSSTKEKNYFQRIYISGNAGDVFTFGGWAFGDSVPLSDLTENRKFSLTFRFYYGEEKDTYEVDFNPDCDKDNNWQFVSARFVAQKAYTAVYVMLSYNYNRNNAFFDGLQLFKEEFGQRYEYDDDTGRLTATIDSHGRKVELTYDNKTNQLVKRAVGNIEIVDGEEKFKPEYREEYTYDAWNNLLTSTVTYIDPDAGDDADATPRITTTHTYDNYGNEKSVTVSAGGKTLKSSSTYSTGDSTAAQSLDGNQLASTTDPLDKTTYYGYNADTGVLEWVQAPGETEDTRTTYTYDALYRTTGVTKNGSTVTYGYGCSHTCAGGCDETCSHVCSDDCATGSADLLRAIKSASGTQYDFTYTEDFDLLRKVSIGGRDLITHEYDSAPNFYLIESTYGNGHTISYAYDDLGRVKAKTYKDGADDTTEDEVTYTYNNSGNLARVTDSRSDRTTRYYYDLHDRLSRYYETGDGFSSDVLWAYSKENQLETQTHILNGVTYDTTYNYNDEDELTGTTTSSVVLTDIVGAYTYDDFGRLASVVSKSGTTDVVTTTVEFTEPTDTTTSSQVATWQNTAGGASTQYSYTYDDRGNITSISDGTYTTRYTYDALNQLIREDNQAAEKTWTYSYDQPGDTEVETKNGGNIQEKIEFAYTTGALDNQEEISKIVYGYTDELGWADLLTHYNGVELEYEGDDDPETNSIGNLANDGTWSYTWEHGRQLAGMSKSGTTISYAYNADGLRISKTVNNVPTQYHYVGDTLAGMTKGNDKLYFVYDVLGPSAVIYNGTTYYYTRNAQGDITGIVGLNSNNQYEQVVSYTYDAWGNPLTTTGSMANTLGALNPLRYRGYVYDSDSGLYYLQSRYYSPAWGRFINADAFAATGQGVVGNNMFAYCNNNPVNMIDTKGSLPFFLITAAIGAIGGAIIGGVAAAKNGENVWVGMGIGAAAGGLAGAGFGAAAGIMLAGSATASTAAVASGAGMLATAVSTGGVGTGVALVVDNISRSVNNVGTVLYSGGNQAMQAATTYANSTGGTTIVSTVIGQVANAATKVPGADFTTVWSQASAAFCNQASGVVNAFVSNGAYRGVDSIFWKIEMPALLSNPRVTGIIIHIFE